MANNYRDRLIANMTSEDIREGQRRAAAFTYSFSAGLNPIETELLVAQLKLVGVFNQSDRTSAVVNNVRFHAGDTKEVKVDDHGVQLTCISIQPKSARFKVSGTDSEVMLTLKR